MVCRGFGENGIGIKGHPKEKRNPSVHVKVRQKVYDCEYFMTLILTYFLN
jgi:hypothetical protein